MRATILIGFFFPFKFKMCDAVVYLYISNICFLNKGNSVWWCVTILDTFKFYVILTENI